MARLSKRDFEALYSALGKLLKTPDLPEQRELLQRAFGSGNAHLCERAARVVREERITGFEAEMRAAFDALLAGPNKADPGCKAKTALAEALDFLDYEEEAPFRRGIQLFQVEGPVPGNDAAVGLRSRCGFALVRLRVPDVMNHIADLLADPEPPVRAAAAEALAYHGDERGAAFLRYKLHVGDREDEVTASVLKAYLMLDASSALPFAERMLTAETGNLEETLLAIGESRAEGALRLLTEFSERCVSERELHIAAIALVTLRSEEATAYLRQLAAGDEPLQARVAREALGELAQGVED